MHNFRMRMLCIALAWLLSHELITSIIKIDTGYIVHIFIYLRFDESTWPNITWMTGNSTSGVLSNWRENIARLYLCCVFIKLLLLLAGLKNADRCRLNVPRLAEQKKPMSGPDNCEVCPGVIYDWKTMVEMICGKAVGLPGFSGTRLHSLVVMFQAPV